MRLRQFLTAFFVAAVLLNGLCPFLGIKWEYSMSMFSNLNYETSNHYFMPSAKVMKGHQYYYVKSLTLDDDAPASALRLKELLERIGHFESSASNVHKRPELKAPVSKNLLCYHIAKLKHAGSTFAISFQDEDSFLLAKSSPPTELSHSNCPQEWSRYDYFSRYPPIKGDYSTITTMIRERGN